MLTFAEPSSTDNGQQRLTAQCGDVPVVINLSEQKLEETLLNDLNVTNHASNGTLTKAKTNPFRIKALKEVPETIFSDLPKDKKVIELLLQDIQRGNHLLLVENRGIENKKIAERLLKHLNRPTEYIQLNRDTTIQSLIEQPTEKNGTVINGDSPLFKAVKYGYVLVVDEVDKPPKSVTSSLNTLMENGKLILNDGRRIISKEIRNSSGGKSADFINVHEDFRMIIMASQSGFPVLEKNEETNITASRNGEIGVTVKAVGSSPKITTVVMGAQGTGPHTATAVASGRAVATATAITYGRGSSTATATASGSSKATAIAHSYDAGVATATVTTSDSSVGDATADAYNTGSATATLTCTGSSNAGGVARAQDSGVATATATTSATVSVNVQAFARGSEVITDTKTRP